MTTPIIQLVSGKYFDFLNPDPTVFSIDDIAHSLSHICRFNGHTISFYSVAQHSHHVATLPQVPYGHKLQALLHDATEAFLGDVTRPLKKLLPEYHKLELAVHNCIMDKFNLPRELHPSIFEADIIMLATERRDLMPADDEVWSVLEGVQPSSNTIIPLLPHQIIDHFLDAFYEYGGENV